MEGSAGLSSIAERRDASTASMAAMRRSSRAAASDRAVSFTVAAASSSCQAEAGKL